MRGRILGGVLLGVTLIGCRSSREAFNPEKKFAPSILQRDYRIYRTVLDEHHPSLYWYTEKSKMDYFFDWGFDQLKDSLTEPAFRRVLSYVTAQIQCGHTSVRWSKQWGKYIDSSRQVLLFPLSIKFIGNKAVITGNLHRKDSVLVPGTELVSINERLVSQIKDSLVKYISVDGGNRTAKDQWLSNRGVFGSLYRWVWGADSSYTLGYVDERGIIKYKNLNAFTTAVDSIAKAGASSAPKLPRSSRSFLRKENRDRIRQLQIDTVNHTALMRLASFGKGYQLVSFFKHSFRQLSKLDIHTLILDVRNNGGGVIRHATLLTRYISDSSFTVADSLYATRLIGSQDRHIRFMPWYQAAMVFATRKKKDGLRHFSYYEKHRFNPKRNNHFNKQVYLITGGNSYSATTLLANQLSKQPRVSIVGEETGGSAYGNSAWMMPDLILPGTKLVVRVPLYRFVMDSSQLKDGRGIQPTVSAIPTIRSIRENKDVKMEAVLDLIKQFQWKQ